MSLEKSISNSSKSKNSKSNLSSKQIKFRESVSTDDNFIIDAWAESHKNHPMFRPMPRNVFFKKYKKQIISIFGISKTIIACNPEDEDQIFGFVVYRFKIDLPIISCIFVKAPFRHMGIGTQLMTLVSPEIKIITHINKNYEWWLKGIGCNYDPFIDWKDYYEIRC